MYMSRYVGEFKETLKNYTEVFDIYYTDDEQKAKQVFYTKEFPEIFPYVAIIDPKKRKALKSMNEAPDSTAKVVLDDTNSYVHKYREIIYFNKIKKDMNKLIEHYLDGELHHYYQSERMR